MKRPSKDEIRELPLYVGLELTDIHIIENTEQAEQALNELKTQTCLGFDTETKPIFRKGQVCPGPTLIQLSTLEKAYLFPTRFECAVSAAREILSNPNIKKLGFGLGGDNKELRNKLDIEIKNTEDLAVKLKHLAKDKRTIGARAGVAMVLKQRLGKGAQKSNWGTYPLKTTQVLYAANDAHCAICIESVIQPV